eukprot:180852-Amphidinium_carterae.1
MGRGSHWSAEDINTLRVLVLGQGVPVTVVARNHGWSHSSCNKMVRRLRDGTPYGKKRKARRAAPKAVREYIVANPKASVRSTAV